jgi:hypothetical protein
MTIENYERAGVLLKKMDAIQKLINWASKGFVYEPITKQDGFNPNKTMSDEIRDSLKLVLPEVEEHFEQMKKNYEIEFANLK